MQGISCVLLPLFQDSQLSPFLVYQSHSPSDSTFVAAMIKNDDNGNIHKDDKDADDTGRGENLKEERGDGDVNDQGKDSL